MHRCLLAFILCYSTFTPVLARSAVSDTLSTDTAKQSSFLLLPIVYLTPETGWAGGAGGVYTFRFPQQQHSTQASQLTFGGAYTQNRQLLAYLSGRVYWGQEQHVAYGELGYYIYNYFYYGVGNENPPDLEELYGVTFPRIRLNYLYRLSPAWYAGGRFVYDGYTLTERAPGGTLAADTVAGSAGGPVAAIGLVANYDTRDNIFWPQRGAFVELAALAYTPLLGSQFAYQRLTADAAYFQLLPWAQHRLAVNTLADFTWGETPFYDMPMVGGTKKMRGYYLGRYRDQQTIILQTEYRAPLVWRLSAVAFGALGWVAPNLADFAHAPTRYAYGAGLRLMIDKTNRVNIRFDVGFDDHGEPAYYFTVGEAF